MSSGAAMSEDDSAIDSLAAPGSFQTDAEKEVGRAIAHLFETSPDPLEVRLANFPRYVRRSHLTRFVALYELFKQILTVKGSIVECGVFRGFSLMTWAKLSSILEPNNLTRRVYGFDSFTGFPAITNEDNPARTGVQPGDLTAGSEAELLALIELHDRDRFLGHMPKVELISGDVMTTIPHFVQEHSHLVISLLFLDLDLYEPTRVALEHFVPRMPAGSILAFDELDNPLWPGETQAALESIGIRSLKLQRFEFDPYIGFAVLQ